MTIVSRKTISVLKFSKTLLVGAVLAVSVFSTLSLTEAAAKPEQRTLERVVAAWPEAQVGLDDEFALDGLQLRAENINEGGIKHTAIFLHYDILRNDELWCLSCGAELSTTDSEVLQIDGFDTATISPVTLEVCVEFDFEFNCARALPITLHAEWEGYGEIESGKFGNHVRGLNVFAHSTSREATSTGSLNDQELGEGTDSFIIRVNDMSNIREP